MPKIRGIKPDFWTDKNIVSLSPLARLLYVGMWNFAADCGHLEDEPIELKMRILPVDNCDIDELINELDKGGRITRQAGVIHVPHLAEHQRIDKRYFTACPACKNGTSPVPTQRDHDESDESQTPPHDETTTGPRRAHAVTTSGPLVDGDGDGDGDSEGDRSPTRTRKKPAKQLPPDFHPSQQHIDLARELGVDLRFEFAQFRDYWISEGRSKADWDATLRNWIRKARSNVHPLPMSPNGEPLFIGLAPDDKR
jgi:hypothetical protein